MFNVANYSFSLSSIPFFVVGFFILLVLLIGGYVAARYGRFRRIPASTIINAIPDPIFVIGKGGTITLVNNAACSVLGFSQKDLLGKPLEAFLPAAEKIAKDTRALSKERRVLFLGEETVLQTREGSQLPVLSSAVVVRASFGHPLGIVVVCHDIHMLKEQILTIETQKQALQKSEEVLREERNRLQAIISSMGEGVLVVDKGLKIVVMNPVAQTLLGISAREAVGQDAAKIFVMTDGDKEIPQETQPIEETARNGKTVVKLLKDNIYFKTSSGKKFPVMLVTTPLLGDGITGTVVVFRDATAERALDEAKTNFISLASHQLRTPLTSMRWFLEMLMAGDAGAVNKAQTKFVQRVYQGTDRMVSLVNLLLQIARVEAGRVKIEPVPIDLQNLVREIAMALKLPNGKSQKVEVAAVPDPFPRIPVAKEVIWQVLQNLLSNASLYSPKKSVIQVSMTQKDDVAEFAIKDKGIGIPKNQQHRIFEKFFRADNAVQLVPEGSGLGLSLVKMLVEEWGGKIWFESPALSRVEGEENPGATFYFTVPLQGMKAKDGEVGLSV